MSCNIVINQQSSLPPKTKKVKDRKRAEVARRGQENYIKKLKEKLLKDNEEAQMTLKEFIDYFKQGLNDPVSTLTTIEETMRIMKEEHNTEINISIGPRDAENVYSKFQQHLKFLDFLRRDENIK